MPKKLWSVALNVDGMSSPPKAVDDPETRSDRRWTWGLNGPQMTEKNVYGRFLDDVVTAFAAVSIPGLPNPSNSSSL